MQYFIHNSNNKMLTHEDEHVIILLYKQYISVKLHLDTLKNMGDKFKNLFFA